MRVLIDIDDADVPAVKGLKDHDGRTVFITGDHLVHAKVVALAVPVSIAGQKSRYKALYELTMIEDL